MVTFSEDLIVRIADELELRKEELKNLPFPDRLGEVAKTIGVRFFSLPSGDRTVLERAVGAILSERKIRNLSENLPPEIRDLVDKRNVRVTPPETPAPPKPPPDLSPERLEEIDRRHDRFWSPGRDD